jgi:ABC-type sulfate transport system permease component
LAKPCPFLFAWGGCDHFKYSYRLAHGDNCCKKASWKTSSALNVLVDIPIIVPSVALGVSLRFFWKETLAFIPDVWLLVFAHLAITYPYFVRSMSAAIERISIDLKKRRELWGLNL